MIYLLVSVLFVSGMSACVDADVVIQVLLLVSHIIQWLKAGGVVAMGHERQDEDDKLVKTT